MAHKTYLIHLTKDQVEALEHYVGKGVHSSREITRARVLLMAHRGLGDQAIAEALHIARATCYNIRRRFHDRPRLLSTLKDGPRPGREPKLKGRAKARLSAIACSKAPTGQARWSLRLLADELVRLEIVPAISHKTVGEYLKKMTSSPGKNASGA